MVVSIRFLPGTPQVRLRELHLSLIATDGNTDFLHT